MLETLAAQTATQGQAKCLIADTGFFSEDNIKACETAKVEPLIAVARENHHPGWRERHTEPAPLPATVTPTETMAHRLKIKDGCTRYALRKQTVEPVDELATGAMLSGQVADRCRSSQCPNSQVLSFTREQLGCRESGWIHARTTIQIEGQQYRSSATSRALRVTLV